MTSSVRKLWKSRLSHLESAINRPLSLNINRLEYACGLPIERSFRLLSPECCDCFASNFSIHIKRMPRLICLFSFESLVQQHSYTLNKCMQPLSSLSLAQRAISVAQKQWKKCKHFHRYKKSGISSVQY